jgi:Legionella pneumophila major outer membrane protein precursor
MKQSAFAFFLVAASALSQAAYAGPVEIEVDGVISRGEEGSGIQNGFDPREVFVGDGFWTSARLTFGLGNVGSVRVGLAIANMGQGDGNGGGGANEYGIDEAKLKQFDLDYLLNPISTAGATVQPFVGLRSLSWGQDHGFRPDAPLGCCLMNSDFKGVGPRLGADVSVPMASGLTFQAGVDASYLVGDIDYEYASTSGSADRDVKTIGGYIGLDYALSDASAIGLRYKVQVMEGTSYDNQQFTGPEPTGKATNVLQGLGLQYSINF